MRTAVAALFAALALAGDPPPPPLKVVGRIALDGVKGRIDHMCLDGAGKRLFVAALENGTVEVVDLEARKRVKTLEGIGEPAGVAWLAGPGRLAVSSGGDGSLHLFDGETLAKAGAVALGEDADNVRADADGKRAWVGYGTGGLACVDGEKKERVSKVEFAGHPEAFALEPSGPRAFVNVPQKKSVVVVDREKGTVAKEFPLDGAASNYPMALDAARHRLFLGCRRPARVVVMDTETGKCVAWLEAPGDMDDVFLDEPKGRLHASGGDGTVATWERGEGDKWTALPVVKTSERARTSLWDPARRVLYVAAPKTEDFTAEILILEAAR
jgi:WD40 repeat protein